MNLNYTGLDCWTKLDWIGQDWTGVNQPSREIVFPTINLDPRASNVTPMYQDSLRMSTAVGKRKSVYTAVTAKARVAQVSLFFF